MNNLFMLLAKATTTTNAGCSSVGVANIPQQIINITSLLYDLIRVGIPLLLIVIGMLDFGKAVIAGKEDEIKSSQKLFVKRLISAAVVFLVLALVELVLGLVASDSANMMTCIKTILGA